MKEYRMLIIVLAVLIALFGASGCQNVRISPIAARVESGAPHQEEKSVIGIGVGKRF